MKKTTPEYTKRILLVDRLSDPCDVKCTSSMDCPDVIDVKVARLSNGTPRNWSRPYHDERIKNDMGGFSCRGFLSFALEEKKVLFIFSGREVSSQYAEEYTETAAAITTLGKRMDKMNATLGHPSSYVDEFCRWVVATGVGAVWMRPTPDMISHGFLDRGSWHSESVGAFCDRVRRLLTIKPTLIAATA